MNVREYLDIEKFVILLCYLMRFEKNFRLVIINNKVFMLMKVVINIFFGFFKLI